MKTKTISGNRSGFEISKLIMLGLFVALAYASLFVFHFKLQFLSFEPKDSIIIISAFMYGPIAGALVAVVTALIEMMTISSTGLYGLVMNIASSAVLAAVAGLIYKHKRTMAGAIISLIAAILVMTAAMVGANVLITPLYMGAPRSTVIGLIVPLLIPFNIVKGIFSASIAMILYKPFITALRAARLVPASEESSAKLNKTSIVVTVVSLIVIVGSLIYFFNVLGGKFDLV